MTPAERAVCEAFTKFTFRGLLGKMRMTLRVVPSIPREDGYVHCELTCWVSNACDVVGRDPVYIEPNGEPIRLLYAFAIPDRDAGYFPLIQLAVRAALHNLMEHEVNEGIVINGVRPFDPHAPKAAT